jgi:hypothetical protein
MENWRDIEGYEGFYQVSDLGNVRRIGRAKGSVVGAMLKPFTSTHGYLVVGLCREKISKKFSVHRLVLSAFTENKGKNLDVRHKDGTRINNKLENLEWGTRSENMQDAAKHGRTNRGLKNFSNKLSENDVLSIRDDGRSHSAIARSYDINPSVVSRIKSRKAWGWLEAG